MTDQAEPVQVLIPLLNPNEPEALLSDLRVANGEAVTAGQTLCVLETTKASQELTAPRAGYVSGLTTRVGARLSAGDTLLWLSSDSGWSPPEGTEDDTHGRQTGLRITEPARKLAADRNLDLSALPAGALITEQMVREHLARRDGNLDLLKGEYSDDDLLIFGAGGHGASVLELIRAVQVGEVAGFLDDGVQPGEEILGVRVLGGRSVLELLAERGLRQAVNAVGGIGDIGSRVRVFELLEKAAMRFPTYTHPSAVIEPSVELGDGVQVFPHAYLGSRAAIGFGSIVNTAAVVSHDCRLGRVVNVSPGTLLAGGVVVEDHVLIGMGVTVNLDVVIGSRARIGNSAVIKADVPAGAVVRAGSVWPAD